MLADTPLTMPVKAPFELVAGLVYGMVTENHLTELETCYNDDAGSFVMVENAIKALEAGDDKTFIADIGEFVASLPQDVADCKAASVDLKAIESWASIFTNRTQLIATISKHYLLHKKAIKADIGTFKSDWVAGEYFQAGDILADLLTIAVGPIEVTPTLVDNSIMAIPDFVAGFLYGFTGDNHLTEVEACYAGAKLEASEFEAALAALEAGDMIKAIRDFKKAVNDMTEDLAPCHAMQDDVAALKAWAEIFKNPTELATHVLKHWELHKRGIKNDIAQEKLDWAAGDYYGAGSETAAVLLGLVPLDSLTVALPFEQ